MIKQLFVPPDIDALGYTDFTSIYISPKLYGKEFDLVVKHELSHIWLQHNLRGREFMKKQGKVNHYLLNIAMDLEIARHLYDKADLGVITRPRSMLKGAVTQRECEKYPDCEYFEQYYLELVKEIKKPSKKLSWDAKHNKLKGKENKKKTPSDQVVKQAKEKLKEHNLNKSVQKIQADLKQYKIKPSLASEIDAVAGRQKIKRIKSYKRPSRIDSDFFKKGEISKRKTPKITVYVDRSGSFDQTKTLKATQVLKHLLLKYRGQVNNDVLFFNDVIYTVDPIFGDGGTNHQLVLEEIVKSQSELSIIITDDDYGVHNPPVKLPNTVVIPVGCDSTPLAKEFGLREFKV